MKCIQINKDTEILNCTFIKTILMIIVVLYHSILFWSGTWYTEDPIFSADLLRIVASWLDTFHIYAFTLISGYLFYYIKEEKEGYKHFDKFLIKKVKRLLVPYFFVVFFWVAPNYYTWNEFDIISASKKFILGIAPSQLWFLLMLFNVFIIAWPLSQYWGKNNWKCVFTILFFYGIGLIGNYLLPNYFQIWTSLKYIIFFFVGFKLRQNGINWLMKIPWYTWFISSIVLFYISNILLQTSSVFCRILFVFFSLNCNIIGAVAAFIILQKIATVKMNQDKGIVKYLSGYSLSIYLFHQQFVYLFISIFNGIINPYFNAIINFVGSLVLSLMLSIFLKKCLKSRFFIRK